MAEKKPMVVIKKITVVSGGGHGGAWKVAFADFMTAMMAFFLVMWLLASQSEQTKKNISEYFSTPSVIEYNFSNYGVQLTLEKLFLDLLNEPLKTLQTFMDPMDRTPNVMGMGMSKVVAAFMADQLGDLASNVQIAGDNIEFEIPDTVMFVKGSARPSAKFVEVLEKLRGVVGGLEDAELDITSVVYYQSVTDSDPNVARHVAQERLELIRAKVDAFLENGSVDVNSKTALKNDKRGPGEDRTSGGFIKFQMKQKDKLSTGEKPRKIVDEVFKEKDPEANVYDSFVKKLSDRKSRKDKSSTQ